MAKPIIALVVAVGSFAIIAATNPIVAVGLAAIFILLVAWAWLLARVASKK